MGGQAVKVTADTNILVRAAMMDDEVQSPRAARLLVDADIVVVTLVSLCEFAWVMRRVYKQGDGEMAAAIRRLIAVPKIRTDRPAVEAGLAVLEAGGDFADGVVAHCGAANGGDVFASFDRRALELVAKGGRAVLDLNE